MSPADQSISDVAFTQERTLAVQNFHPYRQYVESQLEASIVEEFGFRGVRCGSCSHASGTHVQFGHFFWAGYASLRKSSAALLAVRHGRLVGTLVPQCSVAGSRDESF